MKQNQNHILPSLWEIHLPVLKEKSSIENLLYSAEVFSKEELEAAKDLVAQGLQNPTGDYRLLVAVDPRSQEKPSIVGYICYGPTPFTESTWDLYWVVTDVNMQRRGIATALIQEMEKKIISLQGRLVRIETSSLEHYGSAQKLYERNGYTQVSQIKDFYKQGDDLLVYFKTLELSQKLPL